MSSVSPALNFRFLRPSAFRRLTLPVFVTWIVFFLKRQRGLPLQVIVIVAPAGTLPAVRTMAVIFLPLTSQVLLIGEVIRGVGGGGIGAQLASNVTPGGG